MLTSKTLEFNNALVNVELELIHSVLLTLTKRSLLVKCHHIFVHKHTNHKTTTTHRWSDPSRQCGFNQKKRNQTSTHPLASSLPSPILLLLFKGCVDFRSHTITAYFRVTIIIYVQQPDRQSKAGDIQGSLDVYTSSLIKLCWLNCSKS